MSRLLILSFLLLWGCSGLEESEREKLRLQNAKAEYIYRLDHEQHYQIETPKHRIRDVYPWEDLFVGSFPKITRDYFRCKGNSFHPMKVAINSSHQKVYLFDCGGSQGHSLPLKNNEEFIYPILIDLLNYLQFQTNCQVIVTSGHRCPEHNRYLDSSAKNQTSKHLIGAEATFYIKGMEHDQASIIKLIQTYYEQNPSYEGNPEYLYFHRDHKEGEIATPPWYNKEIMVRYFQKNEGRTLDNSHEYPYFSLQVRFNREEGLPVRYNWMGATNLKRGGHYVQR